MASLIVGHTTHDTARIWVRGEWRYPRARIDLKLGTECIHSRSLGLRKGEDYTGVVEFGGLKPDTDYVLHGRFRRSRWIPGIGPPETEPRIGHFRTTPDPLRPIESGDLLVASAEEQFNFIVGSCNLATVKVNNVLALISGYLGFYVGSRTLRRPHNTVAKELSCISWARSRLARVVDWIGYCFTKLTRFRQPPPPFVSSPFLRLAALCDSCNIVFRDGEAKPAAGTVITGEHSGAKGLVVFEPTLRLNRVDEPERSWKTKNARGYLSIVRLGEKQFCCANGQEERLLFGDGQCAGVGTRFATAADDRESPLIPPAFMLHVGDQIYIDFPSLPKPKKKHYRAAYREAWIEDSVAQWFLAQCPQYMILDDHELFNNYARDAFQQKMHAPRPFWRRHPYSTEQYTEVALKAYREYVHNRHAELNFSDRCSECGQEIDPKSALYYAFDHGPHAHFFVLDTRTERFEQPAEERSTRMISCCQMHCLKQWLETYRDDLLFIVSSVPFVAEVYSTADERPAAQDDERSVDKWCAPEFAEQRKEIIRFIYDNKISRAIFLTGDMHCCYHATLKVGTNVRFVKIHELAGGPIYQLRYGEAADFYEQLRGRIETGDGPTPFVGRMEQCYPLANAVMQVSVLPPHHQGVSIEQGIRWKVIPTVAQPRPRTRDSRAGEVMPPSAADSVMSGQISYSVR